MSILAGGDSGKTEYATGANPRSTSVQRNEESNMLQRTISATKYLLCTGMTNEAKDDCR